MTKTLPKYPASSLTIMNELVLPNDTNYLHNLRGGRLLHWMDICAAISAQKHSNCVAVTAAVNNVSFNNAIKLGNLVTLRARVVAAFNTSMEVYIEVTTEDLQRGFKVKCNDAFYTFVALDPNGKPTKVPELTPENEEDEEFFKNAKLRKQLKLLMAQKVKLKDLPELKEQFQGWIDED